MAKKKHRHNWGKGIKAGGWWQCVRPDLEYRVCYDCLCREYREVADV